MDGRTAAQWLAFAERAARTVAYHAAGTARDNNHAARFVLEQGRDGCYLLRTTDASGQGCIMGCDGQHTWYDSAPHGAVVVSDTGTATTPTRVAGRITGTCRCAGRPAVRLLVHSGNTQKDSPSTAAPG